jgi:hypothetical protein
MYLPEADVFNYASLADALDQACACQAMGMSFVRLETENGNGIEGADLDPYCRGEKKLSDDLKAV